MTSEEHGQTGHGVPGVALREGKVRTEQVDQGSAVPCKNWQWILKQNFKAHSK